MSPELIAVGASAVVIIGTLAKVFPHFVSVLDVRAKLLQRKKLKIEVSTLESRIQPATFEDIKRTDPKLKRLLNQIRTFIGLSAKGSDDSDFRSSGAAQFGGIDPRVLDESMRPEDRPSQSERYIRGAAVLLISIVLFGGLYLVPRYLDM